MEFMSTKPSHSICKKNLDMIKFWFSGLRHNLALWIFTEVLGKLFRHLLYGKWKQQVPPNHAQCCTCCNLSHHDLCLVSYINFRFHIVPISVIILYIFISNFNLLNPELNPICYLLVLLGAHLFSTLAG